ncbi:MAG: hypothetical protein HKP16_08145 [Xanthomonadales bacterium]|nr:hypothetical protein [Gammaproteobacteria bacterium]NNJ65523.1 hypothetical protein [Xanthomonadales bacterium]NNK32893.1 hypothetical protein [Xanthomonadales bacterium]
MTLFAGTLLIVLLSCLAMAAGLLLSGRPLSGGCGRKLPGASRCADCPRREVTRPEGACTEKGDEE